jgi:hypothetical protein
MERLEREGVKRHLLFKPNLRNMKVHSATYNCIFELYEKWCTFADFPKTDIFHGVSSISN